MFVHGQNSDLEGSDCFFDIVISVSSATSTCMIGMVVCRRDYLFDWTVCYSKDLVGYVIMICVTGIILLIDFY